MSSSSRLIRQIGGHHWTAGIEIHLQQNVPRQRTFVTTMDTGWVYVVEDTPNSNNSIQLKVFYIDYQRYNINFDSDDFEESLNNLLDNPNNNIISVVNVQTST
tara:strand:- start:168 stop:476 length:309 start_codon:yes stop_codon:yes gene_type:complete